MHYSLIHLGSCTFVTFSTQHLLTSKKYVNTKVHLTLQHVITFRTLSIRILASVSLRYASTLRSFHDALTYDSVVV